MTLPGPMPARDPFEAIRSPTEEECSQLLGEDLSTLAAGTAGPLVEIQPLATAPRWRPRPGSFRLTFEDGRVLKGIRLPSAKRARHVVHALKCVQHPSFPELVSHAGAAFLQDWIPGRPLSEGPWSAEVVRSCGSLHGHIHAVPVPPDSPFLGQSGHYEAWSDDIPRNLRILQERSALGTEELEAIRELTRRVPDQAHKGFIHKDLCAENLVLGRNGKMHLVDNESMTVGPYDYDLARTWYRWSMPAERRMEYLEAYAQHRDPQSFADHFPYWVLVALLKVAVLRIQLDTEGEPRSIRCLRSCLDTLQEPGSPREIMLQCSLMEKA